MTKRRALELFALVWGVALVGIGAAHLAFGNASFIDGGRVSPSLDSEERFFGALTIGYGFAYVWAARQPSIRRRVLQVLAAVTALGAFGCLASIIDRGLPHWFFIYFGVIGESIAALLTYWLSTLDVTDEAGERGAGRRGVEPGGGGQPHGP